MRNRNLISVIYANLEKTRSAAASRRRAIGARHNAGAWGWLVVSVGAGPAPLITINKMNAGRDRRSISRTTRYAMITIAEAIHTESLFPLTAVDAGVAFLS